MKKIALIIFLMVSAATWVFAADDIFFPSKKGMVLTTASLNAKGKPDGFVRLTVKNVSGAGADKSITYVVLPLDNKRKPTVNGDGYEYTINVVNNVLELDMRNTLDAMVEMPSNAPFEITGGKMRLPSKLSVGDNLEDVNMNMSMNMGITSMSVDVRVTNHKCVAVENVTVPAGTFESYKVTHTVAITSSIMGVNTEETKNGATWYARGIGSVKAIVYDAKGKVESTTELQELVR